MAVGSDLHARMLRYFTKKLNDFDFTDPVVIDKTAWRMADHVTKLIDNDPWIKAACDAYEKARDRKDGFS